MMPYKPIRYPDIRNTDRVIFESVPFGAHVQYEVKDGSLIVYCGANGTLALALSAVRELADEMQQIAEVYQKC